MIIKTNQKDSQCNCKHVFQFTTAHVERENCYNMRELHPRGTHSIFTDDVLSEIFQHFSFSEIIASNGRFLQKALEINRIIEKKGHYLLSVLS